MSLAATAILTAIREVVEDATGSVRTIADGRFEPGTYSDQARAAASVLALGNARAEVTISGLRRAPESPPVGGSFALYGLDVEVTVVRNFGVAAEVDTDTRVAIRAAALLDADLLQQALGWPGNLTQTSAAVATGLVSGLLRYEGSSPGDFATDSDGNGVLTSTHRFNGIAKVATPTS